MTTTSPGRPDGSRVRWRRALPIAVGLAAGTYLLYGAVPRLVTQLTGVEGSFRAEHCREAPYQAGERALTCAGSFTAADGSFTLASVEVDTVFEARPTGPVSVVVGGPGAGTAVRTNVLVWLGPGAVGTLALIFPIRAATAAVRGRARPPSRPVGV
ncbi:hypothetical protein OG625_15160 [Streptomyces sp. NBC_01351]|uniref:hypothetical protein n=1 Tax=Streptomyces sp. NBC_01351 TaxID=2903833 RepID=UPI002E381C54|nr:hypothetical protein [Streptomyces sp. NBC_01351]